MEKKAYIDSSNNFKKSPPHDIRSIINSGKLSQEAWERIVDEIASKNLDTIDPDLTEIEHSHLINAVNDFIYKESKMTNLEKLEAIRKQAEITFDEPPFDKEKVIKGLKHLISKQRQSLQRDAKENLSTQGWAKMVKNDIMSAESILDAVQKGDMKSAGRTLNNMDTAARDEIYDAIGSENYKAIGGNLVEKEQPTLPDFDNIEAPPVPRKQSADEIFPSPFDKGKKTGPDGINKAWWDKKSPEWKKNYLETHKRTKKTAMEMLEDMKKEASFTSEAALGDMSTIHLLSPGYEETIVLEDGEKIDFDAPRSINQYRDDVEEISRTVKINEDLPSEMFDDEIMLGEIDLAKLAIDRVNDHSHLVVKTGALIEKLANKIMEFKDSIFKIARVEDTIMLRTNIETVDKEGFAQEGSVDWEFRLASLGSLTKAPIFVTTQIKEGHIVLPEVFTSAANQVYPLTESALNEVLHKQAFLPTKRPSTVHLSFDRTDANLPGRIQQQRRAY